jgi:adenylosuccinate lyase
MGYTHLQPAEPTTIGYRFAFYAQDLLMGLRQLRQATTEVQAKGFKGAVGTAASYTDLLEGTDRSAADLEQAAMQELRIDAALITSQVVSKQAEALVVQVLAMIAAACAKFAADLRILQSPLFGEWSEPFAKTQVGSSAMPFKRNPIAAEKVCSLARYVVQLPAVPLENVMHSYLDRTLDDSANRRVVTAEAFLAVDESLSTTTKLVDQMQIDHQAVQRNLDRFVPFAASEQILMAACKKGADRQQLHEQLKQIALAAWEQLKTNPPHDQVLSAEAVHPMIEQVKQSEAITQYLSPDEISSCFAHAVQVGDAPDRARRLTTLISQTLNDTRSSSQS